MPRVSQQQTDQNRIAIEKASARLFREKGLAGVSVAEVMAAAGLTHGGFYGHFSSKEGLAAVACSKAFESSGERWNRRFAELPDAAARRRAYVEGYLAPATRDRPGSSCAAAALAGDVARAEPQAPVRPAYLAGVKGMAARLAAVQPDTTPNPEQQALADLALLVGALLLSRATKGDAISDEILSSARAALLRNTESTT
ncbi:TetR/AcrR family transcriptional regulator [Pseudorhodoferax sp. Leaf267]|uniref:TetR/AcrR family transcriptional regulator n=1 Tax=Pseudorhodoferax sp. Leaf267 TaxID=1736316 RepID=UPI00070009A9|nr:TetR/AcrR family transcriptional regulator [Pseudorhodoferax sp. Leaf267]KQP15221.1 TetR family transcriptional regulator [Pseudorhodoferax sp. Leaf267]